MGDTGVWGYWDMGTWGYGGKSSLATHEFLTYNTMYSLSNIKKTTCRTLRLINTVKGYQPGALKTIILPCLFPHGGGLWAQLDRLANTSEA